MCRHSSVVKVNDLRICLKCGMTLADNKKIVFDRKLRPYIEKKNRRKNK